MGRGRDRVIDAALRASLAAFDDAALATLANPGLVRRAHRDVAEGKLRLISTGDGRAAVEADGQLVTLDTRGPRAADCACKSVAVCRHRIAAVLLLRNVEEVAASDGDANGEAEKIVAALDMAALERWSGKANWRAALELMDAATHVEPSANAVAVGFAGLDEPVRILRGQGFDGIVSKVAKTRAKAYHAAAVLAARRHFGSGPPETAADDRDAAPDVVEVDRTFLDRVAASLCEVAALGFNLAPLPLEESLFELSVSSRADSLPRLAAMLRAIAVQVKLRRQRAISFDPDRMLELAATAFALTRALAGGDPERQTGLKHDASGWNQPDASCPVEPRSPVGANEMRYNRTSSHSALVGKGRRDFALATPLHLIGCGGERWNTDTGARGVTAWFIEPETGRWLSTTLARGAGQDSSFKPAVAWRVQPMWQAEPLAVLAHARIALEGARRSIDDRLSAAASARATIGARDVRPDPAWPGVVREWRDLRAVWLRQTGLGLEAVETPIACLLLPTAIALPYFDDLGQQLVWPVRDVAGEWLALTLDHEESMAAAIEALEENVRSGWQGMVLVRLMRAGDALVARPVTLFGTGAAIDLTLWQRRGSRPAVRGVGIVQDYLARLWGNGGRRFARVPRDATDAVLAAAWRQLLDCAETGPALVQSLRGRAAHAERLDSHGLPALAGLMNRAGNAAGMLAAAYGLLVARQQRCKAPLLR